MLSIEYEFVRTFIYENLEKPSTIKNGNEFNARCPFCGDSKTNLNKKRFHLKYENCEEIIFHCFNCGISGNFIDLYSKIKGIDNKTAYLELRKFDVNKIKEKFKEKKKEKIKKENKSDTYNFNYILKDCISVNSNVKDENLIKLQKILIKFKNDRLISTPVFISYRGEWKNRLIIPVIEGGRIIFFQGRAINDEILPKYLNPGNIEKEFIIYNKEKINPEKYTIVTEGILDATSIGDQGTACLGANLSKTFLDELKKVTKNIIFALDNDKTGNLKIKDFIEKNHNKNDYLYFLMPKKYKYIKDLNELKTKENIEDLYSFIINNSYDYVLTMVMLKTEKWRKM